MAQTIMKEGEWAIRASYTDSRVKWISHAGCTREMCRAYNGVCYRCNQKAPDAIIGFLNLINWKR